MHTSEDSASETERNRIMMSEYASARRCSPAEVKRARALLESLGMKQALTAKTTKAIQSTQKLKAKIANPTI